MTVATSPVESRSRTATSPRALVIADANWFTTESLFSELEGPRTPILLLKCLDYYNAWRAGQRPWNRSAGLRHIAPGHWTQELVLPSGWMKRFPRLGMRPIRSAVEAWRGQLDSPAPLHLVMTYPHYLFLRDLIRPDVLVYFNLDDYAQYWPKRAAQVDRLERQAVREADITICVSHLRAENLRAAVPEAASRVRHLPHGTPRHFLSEVPHHRPAEAPNDLASLGRPLLGYVGSLEDRVDWPLLDRIATTFPHAQIVLVGKLKLQPRAAWTIEARRCLRRPNVHLIGWRPQAELRRYIEAFDVCLIPYRADHPFNEACCPTKIMDYMGSGRPIVSTDLPECRLYNHLFDVASQPGQFVDSIGAILATHSDDGRAQARHSWAIDHTCARMVDRFLNWLPD